MRKSKNKIVVIILAAIIALPLLGGLVWFKQYYDNRYVLDDYYYTIVPTDYDITPKKMYDSDGRHMGYEKEYSLPCYNTGGKEKELQFRARLDFQELYPPGTYVRVGTSKTTVLEQNALDEADIPKGALKKIKENFTAIEAATLAEYAKERVCQLSAANTPSSNISCTVKDKALIYTYTYSKGSKEIAMDMVELLDPVYRAQFRADQTAFPELSAVFLEIKLDDGTVLFSEKYNKPVKFAYELNGAK